MGDNNEFNRLIKEMLSGDAHSYDELYERTIQDVYKTVHFLIEEKADVDDLVQEIYIQLYKSLGKYESNRHFKPWLMGIVMNHIKAYRRKKWLRIRIVKKAEEYEDGTVVDFSNDIADKITNQQLLNLVNDLPYKLKQVIILRYFNEYSQDEIARILEIPIGTVKSRINSGLNRLRVKGKNQKFFSEEVRNVYES